MCIENNVFFTKYIHVQIQVLILSLFFSFFFTFVNVRETSGVGGHPQCSSPISLCRTVQHADRYHQQRPVVDCVRITYVTTHTFMSTTVREKNDLMSNKTFLFNFYSIFPSLLCGLETGAGFHVNNWQWPPRSTRWQLTLRCRVAHSVPLVSQQPKNGSVN